MSKSRVRSVTKKLLRGHRFRVLTLILVLVVVGLGLLIAPVERSVELATIRSEWDGVYFAVTTVTGVGYGDMVPLTNLGKVMTMILETVGVVLFGSIVAMVAVELLRYQEDYYMRRVMERIDDLDLKLVELKKHVDFLVKK